ncbi:hypothetical protein CDAR_301451 [Caerostris darwini]|uniref:Uncharacterized protein n=1 Tax=Caerostris darwini TaxID=1538125 RepID=A0AAV4WTX1_9ARAC|nr:hypothetical protein CDAR_301451 [Caerostris darwini]
MTGGKKESSQTLQTMIPSESSTLLGKTHRTQKKDGLVNEWEIELVKRPWHIKSIANFCLEEWMGKISLHLAVVSLKFEALGHGKLV